MTFPPPAAAPTDILYDIATVTRDYLATIPPNSMITLRKSIERFHYLTQDIAGISHAYLAEEACRGGARWVQLRVKNRDEAEWRNIAMETQAVCRRFGAVFIINDNAILAAEIGADGVHLGRNDMAPAEARKMLGKNFIIGGTANTLNDVKEMRNSGVDYIGLGPYRFTSTKQQLSPVLGLKGINSIMKNVLSLGWNDVPVIAIGGIRLEDVNELTETDIFGIAISSAVNQTEDRVTAVRNFIERLYRIDRKMTKASS